MRQGGRAPESDFADRRLRAGAALLVAGDWEAIRRLGDATRDFVALAPPSESDESAPAAARAPFALLSLALMIVLMVTGVVPNVIAALIAALLMGAFRAIDMASAYRAIHWPTLLLIAGMLPFAEALKATGGIDLAVGGLTAAFGGAGLRDARRAVRRDRDHRALRLEHRDGGADGACRDRRGGRDGRLPYPFAMTVMLAASAAFVTPVSSR
ncbi:SLC13 family permease [Leucobacter soli]|uniref:SLC13 family permease n=1 Tax=Leucobacter soli TaxID=2812850 RepID=UPI00361FB911